MFGGGFAQVSARGVRRLTEAPQLNLEDWEGRVGASAMRLPTHPSPRSSLRSIAAYHEGLANADIIPQNALIIPLTSRF